MAKKKTVIENAPIVENISIEPLENVMAERYATYAKYVIQDRAIPDVRDGLKPVQRRILFSMYMDGNTFNKPTRKCAHTVGTVMGKYHPHGDSSIYEALAHMSKEWRIRAPLIDFQGNNGSIDGDQPAAYRYTESRLSELCNEMLKDIDKNTVDMQLTFDDSDFEPVVLPSRFPNLLVNGSEGIAVAMATEIPPHNLNEVCDAIIYRINHKTASIDELLTIIKGPDFPTGGIIYDGDGLKSIYTTGRGRIEVVAKAEIVQQKDIQQIVITEIPYKVIKIDIVYEIDKIRHSKAIDGILEVRDESDFSGIRVVIDIKKDARADLILGYLMSKTSMKSSYSANMVAIVDGRPKTLNLIDFIDAYINHQVDVITRRSQFDLKKFNDRLHIVIGLIEASININRVVEIIKMSKDKADSKLNLMNEFKFSNEQAEAIVMMPLYKLSHTDEATLEQEKEQLQNDIKELEEILADRKKLDKVICKDLKTIATKYGNPRRTIIQEKVDFKPINKRDLIAKDEVMFSVTKDGYFKRSSLKSFASSGVNAIPTLKDGDFIAAIGKAFTTDFLICFTNLGNYLYVPVFLITENKWKDEGVHINNIVAFSGSDEKIVKVIVVSNFRADIFIALVTRNGQIKRTSLNEFETTRKSKPIKCMRLMAGDELIDARVTTGNKNIMVLSENGNASLFNENELTPLSIKAGGVKSMNNLHNDHVGAILTFDQDEKNKIILITDNGCERIFDINKVTLTSRLGKPSLAFRSFKGDHHHLVFAEKITKDGTKMDFIGLDNERKTIEFSIEDFHLTEIDKYAKKNIEKLGPRTQFEWLFSYQNQVECVDDSLVSQPIVLKEKEIVKPEESAPVAEPKEEGKGTVEQISIFDDLKE
ncbi:MAG: DNA topoisomerase IV subunit A [Erysipelotrichaceae bacterium]|nr:DNA topoisomerase IV subunit A [Erysipelotrichaceae bacterium]